MVSCKIYKTSLHNAKITAIVKFHRIISQRQYTRVLTHSLFGLQPKSRES